MTDTQIGINLMLVAVMLVGAVIGFCTSRYDSFVRGLTLASKKNDVVFAAAYSVASLLYFVGVLMAHPAAMTSDYYSPIGYIAVVLVAGISGLVMSLMIWWFAFSLFNIFARWYVKTFLSAPN